MTLFRDTFRIESTRLSGWDYAAPGAYFITVCTRGRRCFFGEVLDGQMRLSPAGGIAAEEWLKTADVRPGIAVDEFVVMPNHVHGVIVVKGSTGETAHRAVSTPGRLAPNSLGSIVGQFKSACTRRIWSAGVRDFAWQTRFYDHVIRGEKSLDRIREYIVNNPLNWATDKNNPVNLHNKPEPL